MMDERNCLRQRFFEKSVLTRSKRNGRRCAVLFFLAMIRPTAVSSVPYFIRFQRFIKNVFERRKKYNQKKYFLILPIRIFGVRFILYILITLQTIPLLPIHLLLYLIVIQSLLYSFIIYRNIRIILYTYSRVRIVCNKNNIESVIPINLHFKIPIGFHYYYYFYKIYITRFFLFIYLLCV